MDSIPLLVFDIRGVNPVNTIPGEKIPLKDKTLNWTIPNGSPFFNEPGLLVVRNQAGGILTRDRDYYVEGEFVPFCEITGRSICTFIRVSAAVLAANDFITVDYQSIGAWFVPRNDLQEWLDAISEGNVPIPWSKVFGVPPTLPSSLHLHSAKTELRDWHDFTQFFATLEGIRSTRDPAFDDKLSAVVASTYESLNFARDEQLTRLQEHDRNYNNPHDADAFDIDMGNHDNFRTATLAEDLEGVRSDVLSTPHGVVALAKTYVPDTDKAMLAGIFPISSYGGESFLPPDVTGSYEGLGTETESSAICKEADGSLMVLSNHFDGRVRGLYFSKIEDYNTDNPKYKFTYLRYEPAAAKGLNLNRVVAGSGDKVIMVGAPGVNNWFLGLTNGTLEPRAHALVTCAMGAVVGWVDGDSASIHYMGDYLVLIQNHNLGVDNTNVQQSFYRVLAADVIAGKPVTWTRFNVGYTNYEGTFLSNQSVMQLISLATASRLGPFSGSPEITNFRSIGRVVWLTAPKAASAVLYSVKVLAYYRISYIKNGKNVHSNGVLEMMFDFNPATGGFTYRGKSAASSFNFLAQGTDQANLYSYLHPMMIHGDAPSTVLLSNGEVVSTGIAPDQAGFPVRTTVWKLTGKNTAEAVLLNLLDGPSVNIQYQKTINPKFLSPLLSGSFGGSVVYQPGGELFGAVNQTTLLREVFYREVTGLPQIQSSAKNLLVGDVNARPFTNSIYNTNLLHHDPMINVTGSAADLTAAGVECGFGTLSGCGYSSAEGQAAALPTNPALRASNTAGTVITFPRTASFTLNNSPKLATYKGDTFYGLGQNVIDKLRSYTPYSSQTGRGFSFTLNMLTAETHPGLTGINLAIVQLNWVNETTGIPMTKIILMTPVVEIPNAGHPGVYLIKSLTLLSALPWSKAQLSSTVSGKVGAEQFAAYKDKPGYPERPLLNVYRNGNTLSVSLVGCHTVNLGDDTPLCNIFDINLTTKKLTGLSSGGVDLGNGEYTAMVPRVGISDYGLDVVPGAPGFTYIPPPPNPPIPESWRCNVNGAVTQSAYIMGASGLRAPTVFITRPSGSEGFLVDLCLSCNTLIGNISNLLDPMLAVDLANHYTYQPAHNPPPPPPPPPNVERWTCKVNGNFTMTRATVISHVGGAIGSGSDMIGTTLNPTGTGAVHFCKSCFSEGVAVNGQAGIDSWTAAHYDYVNNTPSYPAGLAEYYLVPPASLYSLAGGSAAIAKKTVGGVPSYHMTASSYPDTRWVVSFEDKIDLMIYGTAYTIEGGIFDLRDIDEDPRNKTFYVYATIEDDKTKYIVSAVELRRSGSLLPVATLVTNNQQILTILRHQPFMIGDHLLSFTRDAGIIPVSSGFPQDAGNFSFLHQAELLP